MGATTLLSIAVCILSEAVVVLAYMVYKIKKELHEAKKELHEAMTNLDTLAGCVLHVAKHTAGIDVVENIETDGISFPNNEGF